MADIDSAEQLRDLVGIVAEQAWKDYHGNALMWDDVANAVIPVVLKTVAQQIKDGADAHHDFYVSAYANAEIHKLVDDVVARLVVSDGE